MNFGTFAAQKPIRAAGDHPIQTVFLHDFAGVPAGVLSSAKAEAARIFLRANVEIEWLDCSSKTDEAGKSNPCPARPPGTIMLRIVPARLDFVARAALGYALMSEQGSVYATISYTRMQECTKRQTKSAASLQQVLGHAMAHELGHILLGAEHTATGLMRADWDASQLDDAAKGRLYFSRDEAKRIQDAVSRRMGDGAARRVPTANPAR